MLALHRGLPVAPDPRFVSGLPLPPFNISFPMTRQPSFTNLKGKLNAGLTKLSWHLLPSNKKYLVH